MSNNICVDTILEIRKLSRFLDKYSKHLNNNYNITLPQLLSLYELSKNESMNLTELTRSINLNNSAMTGIIDRLEAKGYVKRIKKEGDRRTIYLEITETGKNFTQTITKVMEDDCFFDEKKLGKEDTDDMLAALKKVTAALDPEIKKIDLI